MKMFFSTTSFVAMFLLDLVTASYPQARFFQATTPEELAQYSSPHTTDPDELLRGRRLLQDGSIEVSTFILADAFNGTAGFYHSVASGDPLADAVIVWTRYTPVSAQDSIDLELRMAAVDPSLPVNDHLDPSKNTNLRRFVVTVTNETDFVAKLDVTGLNSNTAYVFAFTDGSVASDVGTTKTSPVPGDGVEKLTYATFSCSTFRNGFFHPYDLSSIVKDLDLWIHVGDYIYEYGTYSGTYY